MSPSKPSVTRDEVAGLDIATHTGFFCLKERGTWDFTESKQRNNNKQHGAFRRTLIDFIQRNNIRQIVAEDVSVNNHFVDTRKLSEFRGILFEVCDTLDLPAPVFINPMTLKKFATGDGHAKKDKMICLMMFCSFVYPSFHVILMLMYVISL